MTNYLISYDISEDKLRTKTAKMLIRCGCYRIQKSVFLAPNFGIDEIRQLQNDLKQMLSAVAGAADSVFCVPMTKAQLQEMQWIGNKSDMEAYFKEILSFFV